MSFDNTSDSEFDLAPLVAHNRNIDLINLNLSSLKTGAANIEPSQVPQRPISGRRGKKRSSRACASCRLRKVRCNIVTLPQGSPCSNCRHDEVECVLPLSRRQRAAIERTEQRKLCLSQNNHTTTISNSANGDNGGEIEDCCPQNQDRELDQNSLHQRDVIPQLISPDEMMIPEHPLSEILPAHSASQRGSPILGPTTLSSPRKPNLGALQAHLATVPLSSPNTLPKIFAPFPAHLKPTDISYLQTRGALTLPSESLQVVLLKAYVELIHPLLPILDIYRFLEDVKDGKGGKLSLLLFQAVMLAALEGVSENVLRRECDGMNKGEAFYVMLERVKLLYDFDTSTDRLTILQSLLLLSYSLLNATSSSQNRPPVHKNAHHYLGLALSLSFSLGLHHDNSLPPSQPSSTYETQNPAIAAFHNAKIRRRKLEKRIWWSLFLQDKMIQIHGKGASRLRRQDASVPMLGLEDFEQHDSDDEESIRERMGARAFIERVQLCWWGSEKNDLSKVHQHPLSSVSLYTYQDRFEQAQQQQQQQQQPQLASQSSARPVFLPSEGSMWSPQSSKTPHYAISNSTSEADADADIEIHTPPRQQKYTFSLNPLSTKKELRGFGLETDDHRDPGGVCSLGADPRVDREYDDYLEFLSI